MNIPHCSWTSQSKNKISDTTIYNIAASASMNFHQSSISTISLSVSQSLLVGAGTSRKLGGLPLPCLMPTEFDVSEDYLNAGLCCLILKAPQRAHLSPVYAQGNQLGSGIWLLPFQHVKGCAGTKSHNLFISSDHVRYWSFCWLGTRSRCYPAREDHRCTGFEEGVVQCKSCWCIVVSFWYQY